LDFEFPINNPSACSHASPLERFWRRMNVNGFTRRPGQTWTVRLFLLALLGAGLLGPRPVHGAAAKKFVLTPGEARVFQVWTNYLSAGPQVWSSTHAPDFTPAIRSTIWRVLKTDTQGQSLANPMIDYLLWRRSLNPVRFTANHPNLSPALAQLLNGPSLPTSIPPPTNTSVPQSTTAPQTVTPPSLISPSPQTVSPPAIPEPNSLLLAVGMMGWGLWWRRRMGKRSRRSRFATADPGSRL
jgi:hypothetical protein